MKAKSVVRKAKRKVAKAKRSVRKAARPARKQVSPFASATADRVEPAYAVDQPLSEPRPISSAPPAQAA